MPKFGMVLSLLLLFTFANDPNNASGDDFGVDQVIKALKEDIRTAQATETGKPRLQIDRVDLELSIATESGGEAGLKVSVLGGLGVNMGAGAAQVNGQTIKLTLTPIGDLEIGAKKDHGLAAAIGSVKNALRNAINDPPPLKLDGFVYETEFGIEKTAQGGISFFIIDIAGGKYKQSTIHRLKIHLSLAG